MITLETIEARIAQIQAAIEGLQPDHSPWLRGDLSAARYAGYKSPKSFRAWAKENGIRPSVDGGLNFWGRADIAKARGKGETMNDYYNDPPESPEPPDWYCALEDVLEVMSPSKSVAEGIRALLDKWNQEQAAQADIDPAWEQNTVCDPFPAELRYPQEITCRHGNLHSDCDHCDYLADIAFDAAREGRAR